MPIKSKWVCVSFANDIPSPRPLQAPKTFADVQSGFVALIVVVDCVRPPRRRTLCRRRDLVIIQAALRAVHALQAELVTEGLVRRETFLAGSTGTNSAARDFLADCTALSARHELPSVLGFTLASSGCKTLASVPSMSVYASSINPSTALSGFVRVCQAPVGEAVRVSDLWRSAGAAVGR